MKIAQEKNTPLMEQYFTIKTQYPDSLLFFQVGDFYELFFQDAKTASSFLAIALTKRGKNKGEDIPLCGVPVHALNHYLLKLIKGGFKVAICDQLTKPQPGTVVQRGVTKVLTPGTLTDSLMLDEKSASYLLSFYPGQKQWGLVFSELLTAQLFAVSLPAESFRMIDTELVRFSPDEIILPSGHSSNLNNYFKQQGFCTSVIQPETNNANMWIENQFAPSTLKRLEFQQDILQSLQVLYFYLKRNQEKALDQFKSIQFYEPEDYLVLDGATQRNLELIKNNQDGGRNHTLFHVLDQAKTPMGSRTIKKWIQRPLVTRSSILQRQEVVAFLCQQIDVMKKLEELLGSLADLERIIGRIALNRAQINDYIALKESLKITPFIKELLQHPYYPQQNCVQLCKSIVDKISDFSALIDLLQTSINDDASTNNVSIGIIKKGFDLELDRLRDLVLNGKQEVLKLEQKEENETGISSLKISYNQITGYYIEITNPNLSKIPATYIEIQKLVNRKRFTTLELKALEAELFKAENEIDQVQTAVFDRVKKEVENYLSPLRQAAQALSYLDGLFGLANSSYQNNYVKPEFNDNNNIIIKDGKHPVIEQVLGSGFIPNDTNLVDQESLWIITGPNMGGKSTYLRQVAQIAIMAQCGAFVPAAQANLPILDRIFTRIGSGDNLAQGKSTFLIEMEETATICTQATKNSLVILDEVGRGTSTFDGIALAQAIVEYISQKIKARCLFATHYHELTKLSENFSGIANYNMACQKNANTIIFLHKILSGAANGSFGIDVAKLAQLPEEIINRASIILKTLETHNFTHATLSAEQTQTQLNDISNDINNIQPASSLSLKAHAQDPINNYTNTVILNQLKDIDLDNISPRQALDLLHDIKQKIQNTDNS
ncbi:MAG: DNA mismatch repair protein MutS [Candidatus Babeliales bacterium]|jgi:DNA mismatch repair protein MutS